MRDTSQKEIIVKKSQIDKWIGYILSPALFLFGLWLVFANQKYFVGIILLLATPFVFRQHYLEFTKQSQIVLKVSDSAIWTPQIGYKPWTKIELVKFQYDGFGRSTRTYLEIYGSKESKPEEKIRLYNINFSTWRLKKILKRYVRVE